MLSQSNVLTDLYGTLATVVAVTIALQQQVVAQCFTECKEFSKKVKDTKERQESMSFVPEERRVLLIKQLRVNVPAILVNVLILLPWGYVGLRYRPIDEPEWLYILPWYGLCGAAFFLIVVVLYSLVSLYFQRTTVIVLTVTVSILVTLAIIGTGIFIRP